MIIASLQSLVSLLVGDTGATSPPNDISFAVPSQPRDIARIPSLSSSGIPKPEPRKGCVIGWEKPSSLPSQTVPMEIGDLGSHLYGGPSSTFEVSKDPIGHTYTKYGGIIDVAHVRDHADIARYIATKVVAMFKNGGEITDLGDDTDQFRASTGRRIVKIKPQGTDPSAYQAAVLGAAISYDVAVWHEISTYKTWQDYSCFSPEDNYSNLLGAYLGFRACLTERLEYNDALMAALYRTMLTLIPQPKLVTLKAVEFVEGHWYHYVEGLAAPLPNVSLFLDKRHMATGYNENRLNNLSPSYFVSPWLITDVGKPLPEECQSALITSPPSNFRIGIHIPKTDENNKPLRDFYSFEIKDAANVDSTIFEHPTITNGVDSTKFGIIVEAIRDRLLARDLNIDKPQ
jgi:hypothetical protein